MASTSTPQQGNISNEIGQIGLDSSQVAQLLRTLPGLLKVSRYSSADSSCTALSSAMELVGAIAS